MNRAIPATVLTKEELATPAGPKIQLTFETREGRSITIRSPIEDRFLANLNPQDRVSFQLDLRGCHHLDRRPTWKWLFRWNKLPAYEPASFQ